MFTISLKRLVPGVYNLLESNVPFQRVQSGRLGNCRLHGFLVVQDILIGGGLHLFEVVLVRLVRSSFGRSRLRVVLVIGDVTRFLVIEQRIVLYQRCTLLLVFARWAIAVPVANLVLVYAEPAVAANELTLLAPI